MNVADHLRGFFVLSLSFRFVRLGFAIAHARRQQGRKSAKAIFWIMAGSYLVYITSCAKESLLRVDQFSWTVSLAGLSLFIGALLMRELAMRELGRFFSPDIEIREAHRVIREGLYRYMRHPLLTCMGLEIIGLGMAFNAYYTLLIGGFGLYLPLIWLRKTLEEKTLLQTMGESYRAYQREVGAFVPKLFHKGWYPWEKNA